MRELFHRVAAINLSVGGVVLLLLALGVLSYGLMAAWVGFFWDDFPMAWIAYQLGPDGLGRYFSTNRPVWGWLYQVTTPLIGPHPTVWQFFGLFWRWMSAVAFWGLLRAIWPRHPQAAVYGSLLFLVYPGFRQQAISLVYSHFFIVLTVFVLSLWLSVRGARARRRAWAWHGLALLLAGYNLYAMEYFFLLELIRPLLIWIVIADDLPELRIRLRHTVRQAWPYLAVFVSALVWRVFIFGYQTQNYEMVFLQNLASDPVMAVLLLLGDILQTLWVVIIGAWGGIFDLPDVQVVGPRTLLLGALVASGAGALLSGYLFLARRNLVATHKFQPWIKQALPLGLFACLAGGGSVWLIGIVPRIVFNLDRFTLPFLLGSSLITAGILAMVPLREPLRWGVLVVLVSLAVGGHFLTANEYRRAWAAQERFFWQLSWRIPGLEPGTTILVNMPAAMDYYTDNSLTAPLNWVYAPENTSENMSLLMLYPEQRVGGDTLPGLSEDIPIYVDYLAATFTGNTSKAIALYYEPPACLRVLYPGLDTESPLLPVIMRQAAALSHPELILTSPTGNVEHKLPVFYNDEPSHGWCYYFQKADLARQQGDWEQVVALGEQAFALGDYPNDPLERVPFIEGYAHTGNWERAYEETQEAYSVSPLLSAPLCQLWQRIAADMPNDVEQEATVAIVTTELNCIP